jgi:HD superfamily phosphohydrolase
MIFSDILYGQINLPEWLIPFIKSPEFLRLRGVRLSNVDSFQFKDFNSPTRWEHGIAVAYLALKYAEFKKLNQIDTNHLCLAGLLHDIATPPFAHTLEYVLESFDHEIESAKLLSIESIDNVKSGFPIYASQYPQFEKICSLVNREFKLSIQPDEVAKIIIGESKLGYVINGTIDLDNIDNVTRASIFMGIDVDKSIPIKLVKWLAEKEERPMNVIEEDNVYVKNWLGYRNKMYNLFYNSSDEELGRQAFLQHILRRAHNEGLSQWSMIYNTEELLLNQIELNSEDDASRRYSLKELTQNYRLLERAYKIAEIPIETKEDLQEYRHPIFAEWLEEKLRTKHFEPFVLINNKRFQGENSELFEPSKGAIVIFKLHSSAIKIEQMPDWIKSNNSYSNNSNFLKFFSIATINMIKQESRNKPWLILTKNRKESIKNNLNAVGNWSFKLSRNETIHSYPATFVHAIPSSLISSMGLQGQIIMDPFGGSGQTAIEGIKQGCKVISSDCNSISTLITKVKLTFISPRNRKFINQITIDILKNQEIIYKPEFKDILKWHDKRTFDELCKIFSYISNLEKSNLVVSQFLKLCFSDILTSTTARKGKDYAYFADNTPLPKGQSKPEYVNAFELFLTKINKNLSVIERIYSSIERKGKIVKEELLKSSIFQNDILTSTYKDFKLEKKSVSAIITSPPYLCMIDYTFGNRLSYYWLFPDKIEKDFAYEIGSRRARSSRNIKEQYLCDLKKFALNASEILKKDGFLATVIGTPTANQFKGLNLFDEIDALFEEAGFKKFWHTTRLIHWHRNPGLGKLKSERISVYINS